MVNNGKMLEQLHIFQRPNGWRLSLAFLLAFCVFVFKRPDAILHAQFFAEDGRVWFADAYNLGWWPALFQAHTGYFQTAPRLGAALALLVPFSLAPLVLNLISLLLSTLPVVMLLHPRTAALGSTALRAQFAGIYMLLPNCQELGLGITEAQWVLALCAFLVLVALPPQGAAGRVFDVGIVLLSGLTGPFCIFLLPIAIYLACKRGGRGGWTIAGIVAILCAIQGCALLFLDPTGRTHAALGISSRLFVRLLGGQIYLGALLGANGLASQPGSGLTLLFACIATGGSALVAIHFAKSRIEMRLFLLLAAALYVASLISPTGSVSEGASYWEHLIQTPGVRYWFFPTLAFAWTLLWGVQQPIRPLKRASVILLCIMCIGVIRDFRNPGIPQMQFAEYARRFEDAPAGTTVMIPLYPKGWSMQLTKHPAKR